MLCVGVIILMRSLSLPSAISLSLSLQGYLQTTKLTLNRENGLFCSEVEVYAGGWAGDCPSGWGIVQYPSGQVDMHIQVYI